MTVIRPADEILEQPFWRHLAAGVLHVNTCLDCGGAHHPPAPICPHCRSFNTGWRPARGGAVLKSYAVARHAVHPMLAPQVPYVITLVELDEGVRMVSGLPAGVQADLRIGMPLRCHVVRFDARFALPYFLPDGVTP